MKCPSCNGKGHDEFGGHRFNCLYCRGTGEDPGPRHIDRYPTDLVTLTEIPPAFRDPELTERAEI